MAASSENDLVAGYRRHGFAWPFPALSGEECARCLDGLARYERWLGCPVPEAEVRFRTMPYLLLPWVADLARDARILDVVERLLGPDILIWTGTFFIKEAHSATYAAWHQDGAYFGLDPPELVTAWVALSDASHEAGCMEMLSLEDAPRLYQHATLGLADSINRAGQCIVEPIDGARPVAMPLPAGAFSLHGYLSVHRSAPNRAAHRRVGLGLNYMAASTRPSGSVRPAAMLVRGEDRYGHFELVPPPAAELDDGALAMHARATALYRQNYAEQQRRHEEEQGPALAAVVEARAGRRVTLTGARPGE